MFAGAAFVGVLIVAAVALTLLQREQSFEVDTPERAVQDFLKAYTDEHFGGAYDLWAGDLRRDCDRDEYVQHSVGSGGRLDDSRIRLTDTEYIGDNRQRAVVLARETRVSNDGPFSTSEWSNQQRYELALEQGQWRFTEVPWPSAACPPDRLGGGIKSGPASTRPMAG